MNIRRASIYIRMLFDKLMGKKIFVLDLEEHQFSQYIKPIYDKIKDNNKLSIYLSSYPIHLNARKNNYFSDYDINKSKYIYSKYCDKLPLIDFILSAHVYTKKHPKTKIIHIYHNQPVKYEIYPKEFFKNLDIHFCLGELNKKLTLSNIEKHNLKDIEVYNIGYPKTDDLINGKFNRDDILKELNLDISKKTIIYAPTWDENLSLRTYGKKIFDEFANMKDYNFIIKLHPVSLTLPHEPSYKFYTGGINWREIIKPYESYPNIAIIIKSEFNISPLLVASDLMITDLSSAALEYMLLDRPIIYFNSDKFYTQTMKSVYGKYGVCENPQKDPMVNAGRHTGVEISIIDEMKLAIEDCIKNPHRLSNERKELLSKLYYNKGKASEYAAKEILRLCKISE